MQTCIVREGGGGGYLFEGPLGQASSSPEVEDTTHLRKDVIIYLSDFATVFGCVEREGCSGNYVFVCHLEQVQANTQIMSRLDSVPPLNVFFKSQCGQKGTLSLGLNTT